jgi:hypothetical protein
LWKKSLYLEEMRSSCRTLETRDITDKKMLLDQVQFTIDVEMATRFHDGLATCMLRCHLT